MKVSREVGMFILSVFEQSGVTVTPELSKLVDLTFGNADQKLVMRAALEAMKTARGRITIAEIQKHLDLLCPPSADEHPTAEEAWSLIPKSEDETAMLTGEMQDAFYRAGIRDHLERGDHFTAQRAFTKLYDENVAKSRAAGRKAEWVASVGSDKSLRIVGLEKAVSRGRMTCEAATQHDPENQAIYLSAERKFIESLPESEQLKLSSRVEQIGKKLLLLSESVEPQQTQQQKDKVKNQELIAKAKELGMSVYDYIAPLTKLPESKRLEIFAKLNSQYGINFSPNSFNIGSRK